MRKLARIALRLAYCVFGLLVLISAIYGGTVLYVLSHMGGTPDIVPAECAIVFGTAVKPLFDAENHIIAYTAGPGIDRRVRTAATLYAQGQIQKIFLTGGKGEGTTISEAGVMRKLALSLGVPAHRIVIEEQARSTWENLLNTRPLTEGCHSRVAISDGYHLARIGLLARAQGWSLPTYPTIKEADSTFTLQNVLREAAGIDLLVLVH